jgi:hypothetical protein
MLAQLDPSSPTTDTVVDGLRALGITVLRVSSDGRMIDAQAPSGVLASALGLRLGEVIDPGSGLERVGD